MKTMALLATVAAGAASETRGASEQWMWWRPRPTQPPACCRAMTADCLSCNSGVSKAQYCAANPQTVGCPPQACCRAYTATCMSCVAGQTEAEYCAANPGMVGCDSQQQGGVIAVSREASEQWMWWRPRPTQPPACCRAMTADCLSCNSGVSKAQYCAANPQTAGCPPPQACCRAFTATCMSCVAGQTEAEYCAANPGMVGCDSRPTQPRACCRAMTADCLSCNSGTSKAQYCAANPQTLGC